MAPFPVSLSLLSDLPVLFILGYGLNRPSTRVSLPARKGMARQGRTWEQGSPQTQNQLELALDLSSSRTMRNRFLLVIGHHVDGILVGMLAVFPCGDCISSVTSTMCTFYRSFGILICH